ncbi:phage tail protein [Clostridium perfringens]|uniref:phage tail spike protein n=1 Tax=Clostridium perfringens TaxID=1502 RepID=UPI0022477299|nr:phage tail spike protein [Clostridium perfringens]MCX0373373.1 phage tail protein [Clostridium perfringens]
MIELRDKDKNRVAGLVDYENLCIESVLESGDKTLSFYYPKKGKYYDEIVEEAYIRTKKDEFVVKARELDEDYTKFECSLNLEELEGNIFDRFESVEQTITSALNLAVVGTGWTVKDNTLKKRRTVRCTNKSSLEIVRESKKIYRVDIVFNTLVKQIEVYEHLGEDKGTYFIDSLNLIALQVQSDSRQYATRIIAEGKDGLSFSDINNGKNYVENYQYSNKIKTIYWKDERYSVKESLLEDARAKLEELSKPFRSYSASVLNLAELNPRYSSILDFKLGDAINLISKKNKIKDKQRIVKTIEWPQDHTKDSVELANATLKFEDMQQENQETTDTVSNITTDNGTVDGSTIDSIQVKQIENFEANVLKVTKLEVIEASINHLSVIKADIQDLHAVNAKIGTLEATKANITELNAVSAEIQQLNSIKANIVDLNSATAKIGVLEAKTASIDNLLSQKASINDLNALNATISEALIKKATIAQLEALETKTNNLIADKANIKDLNVANANINKIQAETANIKTLLNGNLSSENIQAGGITSDKLTIANGFITNLMISSVSASKITAGTIDAAKINVVNLNADNLTVGKINGQLLKDGSISGLAIENGAIDNNKVSPNANIEASKINISSVVTAINEGSTLLTANKVTIDSEKGTLDVAFNNLNTSLEANKKITESNSTAINVVQGKLSASIENSKVLESKQKTLEDNYNRTVITVDSLKNTVGQQKTLIDSATGKITSVEVKANTLEKNLSGLTQTVNDTKKVIENNKTVLESKNAELKANIDSVSSSLSSVSSTVDKNNKTLVAKTNTLEQNLSGLSQTVANNKTIIDGKITSVEGETHELKAGLGGLTSKLDTLKSTTDSINKTVSNQGSVINQLKDSINLKVDSSTFTQSTQTINNNIARAKEQAIIGARSIPDTRSNNENPGWYMQYYAFQTITEFKYANVIGVPNGGSWYGTLETTVPWNNASGGYPTQVFRSNSSPVYQRHGIDLNTWSSWEQIEDTQGSQAKANNALNNAKSYSDSKKQEAIKAAENLALEKSNLAKKYAEDVATAKANLAKTEAIANADGKISAEEQKRIQQAQENLKTAISKADKAKQDAILEANRVAELKKQEAINSANSHADSKANEALNNAKAFVNAEITTVKSHLNKATAEINVLKEKIESKVSQSDIDKSIQEIKIGGINLLRNSDYSKYSKYENIGWDESLNGSLRPYLWSDYNSGVSNPSEGYHAHLNITKFSYPVMEFNCVSTSRWLGSSQYFSPGIIKPNCEYTFSIYLYGDSDTSECQAGLYYFKNGSDRQSFYSGLNKFNIKKDEWNRYEFTFKTSDDLDVSKSSSFYIYGYYKIGKFYCTKSKLEEGKFATGYSKAPEDMDQLIIDNIKTVTDKITTVESKLTQENNSIKASVQDLNSTTQSITTNVSNINRDLTSKINSNLDAAKSFATDIATNKANTAKQEAISSANSHSDSIAASKANEALNNSKAYTNAQINTVNTKVHNVESNLSILSDKISTKVSQSDIDKTIENVKFANRNYLKKSLLNTTNSDYCIARLYFGDEKPQEGEEFTVSIKGELGEGKHSFGVYNSGGTVSLISLDNKNSDGIYKGTFKWRIGTSSNTYLSIYTIYSSVVVNSTIEWVKLEKGNKVSSDWTPAPEDTNQLIADNVKVIDTKISDVSSSVTQLRDSVTTQINSINSKTHSIETTLGGKANKQEVTEVNNRVATIKANLDGITQRVSATESKTQTLESNLNGKASKQEVSNVSSKVVSLETNLNGITNRVSNTESRINTLDGKVASAVTNQQFTEFKQSNDKFKFTVEQRSSVSNILPNGSFFGGDRGWLHDGVEFWYGAYSGYGFKGRMTGAIKNRTAYNNPERFLQTHKAYKVKKNTTYTISFHYACEMNIHSMEAYVVLSDTEHGDYAQPIRILEKPGGTQSDPNNEIPFTYKFNTGNHEWVWLRFDHNGMKPGTNWDQYCWLYVSEIGIYEGDVGAVKWTPKGGEVYSANYQMDGLGFKGTFEDGTYASLGRDGLEWYNAGTGHAYHALTYVTSFDIPVGNPGKAYIKLPAEFTKRRSSLKWTVALRGYYYSTSGNFFPFHVHCTGARDYIENGLVVCEVQGLCKIQNGSNSGDVQFRPLTAMLIAIA